jgi:hypothetical protein
MAAILRQRQLNLPVHRSVIGRLIQQNWTSQIVLSLERFGFSCSVLMLSIDVKYVVHIDFNRCLHTCGHTGIFGLNMVLWHLLIKVGYLYL